LPAIKFAGAEVNRGDDATVLVFCRVLTDADIELINRIRKALSRAMGTQLGESGNGKILRRDLAILLVEDSEACSNLHQSHGARLSPPSCKTGTSCGRHCCELRRW
jgi:hypothetical protein